jgi:type II secretion system protein H
MPSRLPKCRAFTLVELMVVLVLISIFTGLIVGEMRGTFEDALLRGAARKLVSAANFAGSQAVSTSQPLSIRINPVNSEFSVRKQAAAENGSGVLESGKLDERITVLVREQETTQPEDAAAAPETEERSGKTGEITFYADGTADPREILLRDRMGVELLLRVSPITGRVKIVNSQLEGRP